jgi:hypothetical protein
MNKKKSYSHYEEGEFAHDIINEVITNSKGSSIEDAQQTDLEFCAHQRSQTMVGIVLRLNQVRGDVEAHQTKAFGKLRPIRASIR